MLYKILKFIVKIAVKFFFKTIHVRNAELIPKNVPLIIAANHPSTFMDPLVIGVQIKQQLYFLAKGIIFSTPFKRWVLNKLHMIPIYRKQDNPALLGKNEEIFQKCYQHLEENGALLIFPEGISVKERRLDKIKTGTARIALGAEAENNFKLGVVIVPVGLNYSEVGIFRSELFINFDKPIAISQFFKTYIQDHYKGVNALTEHIRKCLEQHTISIENELLDQLVKNIEIIYKSKLRDELGISFKQKKEDFLLTKGIVDAVYHFHRQDSQRVENLRQKIQRYMGNLERLNLKDDLLQKGSLRRSLTFDSLRTVFFTLLGFPIYLFGLINNYLPYRLPGLFSKKFTDSVEFQGPIKMVVGTLLFPLFYTLQIWIVASFSGIFWAPIIYGIALPFSGFFVLRYWYRLENVRSNLLFMSLFYRRSFLISKLIQQRREIVKILEDAKQDYFQLQGELQ